MNLFWLLLSPYLYHFISFGCLPLYHFISLSVSDRLLSVVTTNDISTETITAMIATEQYAIRIYADIEKDAADIPGYQKPLFLDDKSSFPSLA